MAVTGFGSTNFDPVIHLIPSSIVTMICPTAEVTEVYKEACWFPSRTWSVGGPCPARGPEWRKAEVAAILIAPTARHFATRKNDFIFVEAGGADSGSLPFQNVRSDKTIAFLRLAPPDEITTLRSHTRFFSIRPLRAWPRLAFFGS